MVCEAEPGAKNKVLPEAGTVVSVLPQMTV